MYCKKCGSPVEEYDNFCRRCGSPIERLPVNGIPVFSSSISTLFKGMLIGISATILAVCSWVAYSTFIAYSREYSQLISIGASPNDAHYVLIGLPGTMGICVAGAIYSSFVFIISVLDYFSPTVRALINSKKLMNRIGDGLVTVGVTSIAFSGMYYFFDLYSSSTIKIDPNHMFALIGLILLTIGILVFAFSYFRSRRQATKV